MLFEIILITLSTTRPCEPFTKPRHCSDIVTRTSETFSSKAACERSTAYRYWQHHIGEIIHDNTLDGVVYGDTGGVICLQVQP